jgi:hypothetical protein
MYLAFDEKYGWLVLGLNRGRGHFYILGAPKIYSAK